jgi:acyl phosphate:glycerol-3-phosphate acyltransferase
MEPQALRIAASLAAAYLLGSLPVALVVARMHGVDIFKVGSGNPGMTNVWRTLGWKPALPVAILDAGKGTLAAWLAMRLTGSMAWALAAGVVAVLGHSFTCFARFKGGKGVLTTFGVFLWFVPASALAALAAWAAIVARTRYVSLGSITAAVVLPAGILAEAHFRRLSGLYPVLAVALALSAFVLYRHRSNMGRLLQGTESKIGGKPA